VPTINEDIDGPLKDIEEIVKTRQELTPEETIIADKLIPHLKATLKPGVRAELEVEFIKKQKEYEDTLYAQNQATVKQAMEDWKKDQKPLDDKEIQTLLNQEYETYTLNIPTKKGTKSVTLIELPQSVEKKILKVMQKKLVPMLKGFIAAEFKLDMESSTIDKFQSLIEAFPELLTVITELVIIILDPWGEDNEIDEEWVSRHLSSNRLLAIIIAQIDLNKYRDFFLNGFRLSKNLR
jgi:hypothetical protein